MNPKAEINRPFPKDRQVVVLTYLLTQIAMDRANLKSAVFYPGGKIEIEAETFDTH